MKLSKVIPFLIFAVDSDHAKIEQQFQYYHFTYEAQFTYQCHKYHLIVGTKPRIPISNIFSPFNGSHLLLG